jgi:hypothetical protein
MYSEKESHMTRSNTEREGWHEDHPRIDESHHPCHGADRVWSLPLDHISHWCNHSVVCWLYHHDYLTAAYADRASLRVVAGTGNLYSFAEGTTTTQIQDN